MEHDLNGKNMDDEEQKLKNDPLTYMCWLLLYFMKQKITTEFFQNKQEINKLLTTITYYIFREIS